MKLIRLLKHELAADASTWVARDIVSTEQAQAILATYGTSLPTGERKSRGYYILLSFAALFMGMALIVFVSANWDQIPRAARMLALIGTTLAFNGIGIYYYMQERINPARIWLFLGGLAYGTSIFLIAQIYHLGEHFPDGVFYWALGVLPMALLTNSILLMLLSGSMAVLWLWMQADLGFFPWPFPLFAAATLWFTIYRRKSLLLFLGTVVSSIFFLEVCLSSALAEKLTLLSFGAPHVALTVGIFILLYAVGKLIAEQSTTEHIIDYGLALRAWSLRFGLFTLILFSFDDPWRSYLRGIQDDKGLLVGILVIVGVAATGIVRSLSQDIANRSRDELMAIVENNLSLVVYSGFFILTGLMSLTVEEHNLYGIDTTLQVMTNLVLFASGIWLIIKGFRTSSSAYFYTGSAITLLTALCRYFDLIGGYVGGTIMFALAGAIMFAIAKLWKHYLDRTQEVMS